MAVHGYNPGFGLKGALADATLNTMLVEMIFEVFLFGQRRQGEYV